MVKFFNEKIKRMNCWDMAFVKLASMAGGLAIFKAIKIIWGWDAFEVSIWYWVVIMVVLAIKPGVKVFKKE